MIRKFCPMQTLQSIRQNIRNTLEKGEETVLEELLARTSVSIKCREQINKRAAQLVHDIRSDDKPGLMEEFLAQYGLSTDEGIALMCLAEALLRVPDATTISDLIEDKIAPSSWNEHLGKSSSSLVNASSWALMLTGKVLDNESSIGVAGVLHGIVKKLGEPVIRTAVRHVIKEMGRQFVLGENISGAITRAQDKEKQGYTYSYDMLGEAALTKGDAEAFFNAYKNAIETIATTSDTVGLHGRPGISIKLSALHPRYEVSKKETVVDELAERALELALCAKNADIGINIDAEESERLDLSLDIIEKLICDERLAGWDGLGVVVQAYGKRAHLVLDWLYELAKLYDRKILVRLVKGAYWDSEIKKAQVEGLDYFPVFTTKQATDVSYICCISKLFSMSDRIYPQFATHNAHTAAAVLELSGEEKSFEFQRLHGMGDILHRILKKQTGHRCRIYAPVGEHRDLLAYLVRRLLENGANSSFVNQIVDTNVSVGEIVQDPFDTVENAAQVDKASITHPTELFIPERINSEGWDLSCEITLQHINKAREPYRNLRWQVQPVLKGHHQGATPVLSANPADFNELVADITDATMEDLANALDNARSWSDTSPEIRAETLNRAASLFEENFGVLFAVLSREAGKTIRDAVAEIREAVDFLRYYAARISELKSTQECGIFACISPWNFPIAIFTGQVAAALAAGNGVIAKPAEQTPANAMLAVKLLHQAGVPEDVLQLLPGDGATIGAGLVKDKRINGVCFTGSTETAQVINRTMAEHLSPSAPLIAETGGLNAMIVDSTALPEQAVRDVISSAFQSAGQRCSALRILYLQEDIAPAFLKMLYGAMDELTIGNPWELSTDIGPVIDNIAREDINSYIARAANEERLLKQLQAPDNGNFVGPAVIQVNGIDNLEKEVFGPVLHIATFSPGQIEDIIQDINNRGYGLTFGLHTRIDDRVEKLTSSLKVGNIYVNRNQIGAIVGSQPFGGEGLSGTGPKAGGPNYLKRFTREAQAATHNYTHNQKIRTSLVQEKLDSIKITNSEPLETLDLPGPTGESNRLSFYPRGIILCLGPSPDELNIQKDIVLSMGCQPLLISPGAEGEQAIDGLLDRVALTTLRGFSSVVAWSDPEDLREIRIALSKRAGPIIPLITERNFAHRCILERHVCVDTTASGGNITLLSSSK